ncbi:uncharacterized protein N0V89_010173 [Didymosphaeria variabile]|uniref:non-specific serine/threonine protein kinase n=1 Tax=Didymosphaeria variabile TaxID=1932322 RepID=A0A9W9C8C1_9PLEO|nr:uncharacterized protein N0V89_010173 [Didymosphaeria variabile]KAJ4348795.1 hypothetical protein N0V89_010173 [Didymosphaeria variabile]
MPQRKNVRFNEPRKPLSKWAAQKKLSSGANEIQTRPSHPWTIVRKLGAENRGALNGGVYIVKDRRGVEHIEKRATADFVKKGVVLQEITILKYLSSPSHEHITRMVDHFVDRKACKASIYLEYCTIGGLETLIHSRVKAGELFNEIDVWEWFIQLFDALTYCHYGPDPKARFNNTVPEDWQDAWDMVFHRDIKVENILVHRGTPKGMTTAYTLKLADFGCAVARRHIWVDRFKEHNRATFATWGWMPPESPQFVGRSDVWQLAAVMGCVCNVMVMPWFDHARPAPGYSATLNNAIVESMKGDFTKRPKSDEVLDHVRGKYKVMLPMLETNALPVPTRIDEAKRMNQIKRGREELQAQMQQVQQGQQASAAPAFDPHAQGNGRFGAAGNVGLSPAGYSQVTTIIGRRQNGRHGNMRVFPTRAPNGYESDDSLNGDSYAWSPRTRRHNAYGRSPYMAPYGRPW